MAKEIDDQQDYPVFKNSLPSNMWFSRFLQRNHLSLRTTLSKSLARLDMETPEIRDEFFNCYEAMIAKWNFTGADIYNEDETGLQLVCKSPRTLAKRGSKYVFARKTGERSVTISLAACSNALGSVILPPFLIFKGMSLAGDIDSSKFPENALFTHSKSGYMVTDVFLNWLHVFNANIPPKRPVLLLLDGHASHISLPAIQFAKDNGIEMLCLPPHTSHFLQPMDSGPFNVLKQEFKDAANKRMRKIKRALKISDFGSVFKSAWEKTCSQAVMKAGFVRTGVWPVNRTKATLRNDKNFSPEATSTPSKSNQDSISLSSTSASDNQISESSTSANDTSSSVTEPTPNTAVLARSETAMIDVIKKLLIPSPQKDTDGVKKSRRIYTSR